MHGARRTSMTCVGGVPNLTLFRMEGYVWRPRVRSRRMSRDLNVLGTWALNIVTSHLMGLRGAENTEVFVPVVYTLLSCRTGFHRIGASNTVVWDEAHLGKLGSHHLKREFYFDVHSRLGKMLVGLAGLLSGYGGRFEFKSGEVYPDTVPYVAMQVMLATFGVLMVPLAWFTSVELGMAQWACRWFCLVSSAIDVGWLCISRFILLDSVLLLFAFLTFSIDRWVWLFFTGISIGCVTRVKMIGLFVTALVGVYTVEDLWDKFGDTRLIMSHPFQTHDFYKNPNPLDVAFGSRVTLKDMDWGGGLLHSPSRHTRLEPYEPEGPLRYLKDGDTIHLSHVSTGRNNLRSHTVTEPVSKLNYEMSGYWNLTIVDDTKRGSVGQGHSLTKRMRFKHLALGCYLRAANAVLPQWGFKQIEVSCDEENDAHTYWNVESHWNDRRAPPGDMKLYKSPFLRDFWRLNVAMTRHTHKVVLELAEMEERPVERLQSKYILLVGIRDERGIRRVVWWGSTTSLGVALLKFAVYILRWQRKCNDMDAREWDHFLHVGKIAFFGWAFHYVPFLIMGRVAYLHHYLPTLYFAVLMFRHVLDHLIFSSRRFSTRTKAIAFGVLVSILVATFWWFSGVAFGIDGPVNEHWGLKWRKTWNIYND
ncbi:glycosyltransferase family 39 protein [Ephemerocybe angulata]|uniref:Dolichyl-phosphate-mannose--protein mannosyltransferase n=1 Tax=Ephemerocybe angulata TaxID=980116 RepID=A0A8H6HIL4_9AGAR|nr:glycosyltransferase family 39 protein [Tulosesus angulatus]